jgi:hypothetical protein
MFKVVETATDFSPSRSPLAQVSFFGQPPHLPISPSPHHPITPSEIYPILFNAMQLQS